MAKIIFVIDENLKLYYEGVARQLSVKEKTTVSLSEVIRRALKTTYGQPKKGEKQC